MYPFAFQILPFFFLESSFLMLPHAGAAAQGVQEGLQIACSMAILKISLFCFEWSAHSHRRSAKSLDFGAHTNTPAVPGESAGPLLLGLIGGYPIVHRRARELPRPGTLSRAETEELPSFLQQYRTGIPRRCGGGLCGSVKIGLLLYGIHIVTHGFTDFSLPHHPPIPESFSAESSGSRISFSESLVAAANKLVAPPQDYSIYHTVSMLRHVLEASCICIGTLSPVLPCFGFSVHQQNPQARAHRSFGNDHSLTLLPATCRRGHSLPRNEHLIAFWRSVLCQTAAVMNGLSIRRASLYGKALCMVFLPPL